MRSPVDDLDYLGSMAGAYDPGAQNWLGWGAEGPEQWKVDWFEQITDANREHMHTHLDGSGDRAYLDELPCPHFTVFTREDGRYAGAIQLFPTGDGMVAIEAWLSLPYRRRGFGRELFSAAARLAHHHLGTATVTASVQADHTAAIRALEQADYTRQPEPFTTETLPDGRTASGPTYTHHHPKAHPCNGVVSPASIHRPSPAPHQ